MRKIIFVVTGLVILGGVVVAVLWSKPNDLVCPETYSRNLMPVGLPSDPVESARIIAKQKREYEYYQWLTKNCPNTKIEEVY